MKKEFKKAFIERYGSDHYLASQLDRIYNENQEDIKKFYEMVGYNKPKNTFRVATRQLECMASHWINKFDSTDFDSFKKKREFVNARNLSDKIEIGEEYTYYLGINSCSGMGEYTAKIKAHEFCLAHDVF